MGDRILVLKEGTVQQIGAPAEIYGEPANLFVAGFVGSPRMNLLPVHPGENGRVSVEGYDSPLSLDGRVRRAYERATMRDLILGVRPEDVDLATAEGPGRLPATVYTFEPLGDRTIYDLRVGRHLVKVKAPAGFVVEIGSPLWFRIDMERAHLFDAASGARIVPEGGTQEPAQPARAGSTREGGSIDG